MAITVMTLSGFWCNARNCEENVYACPPGTTCVNEDDGFRCELALERDKNYNSYHIRTHGHQKILVTFAKKVFADQCNTLFISGSIDFVKCGSFYVADLSVLSNEKMCKKHNKHELVAQSEDFLITTQENAIITVFVPDGFKLLARLP